MGWEDDAAAQLERLSADPLAGAVPGTATIVSAAPPSGRARYQECRVTLRIEAVGVDTHEVETAVVIDRPHWPTAGTVLPARVSTMRAGVVDVDWQVLAR